MDNNLYGYSDSRRSHKKIEVDLLDRHKHVKRKIEALKKRRIQEELKHNQSAPRINSKSKRIAMISEKKMIYSPNRLQRTQEILRNSRFMPKKVKISLTNLESKVEYLKNSPLRLVRYDTALSSPRENAPITYPSLQRPNLKKSLDNIEEMPSDISLRNELLFGLRKEVSSRGFYTEPIESPNTTLSFHERSQKWLLQKNEKIQQQRDKNAKKATFGCTFKPELRSRLQSTHSTQRTVSVETSYSDLYTRKRVVKSSSRASYSKSSGALTHNSKNASRDNIARLLKIDEISTYNGLCPVPMSIGYTNGFSSNLKKKAKPMFVYQSLKLNA